MNSTEDEAFKTEIDENGGIKMSFNVEDHQDMLTERDYIKELMEDEESKLYNFPAIDDNDTFFGGVEFKKLLSECGIQVEDSVNHLAKVEENEDGVPIVNYIALTSKMTDISDDQKLVFKRVVRKGEAFEVPDLSLVIYHYKFYHQCQTEPFDSTAIKGRPDRQRVGVGQLLAGLDLALRSMHKKERAVFVFDYKVMFGEMGVPPRIPGKADIYAEIEVIDFTEKNLIDDFFEKSSEERLEYSFDKLIALVVQCRDDANAAFRNQRYAMALNKYLRGLDILYAMPLNDDDKEEIRWRYVVKLQLNMALSNLKLNRGAAAIKCCNVVLTKQPNNAKALYRKAKGLIIIGDYDDAARCLKRANKLVPNDQDVIRTMKENEDMKVQYYQSEKSLARLMLNEPEKPKENDENKKKLPDLNCEIAKDFREQLNEFMTMEKKTLPKLRGLSTEETNILKALCEEYNLDWIINDGILIKKKN